MNTRTARAVELVRSGLTFKQAALRTGAPYHSIYVEAVRSGVWVPHVTRREEVE